MIARTALALGEPLASEDAYITFRYARNLAEGAGLVYNPGEHVMGFTSPLWTLWCALGFAVHCDPVWWTRLTVVVTDCLVIAWATDHLSRRYSKAAAWAFALFYAVWPLFAASAVSGLESNVVFFLMFAAARAMEREHPLAGPVLGLLAVSRPEGTVAAIVLALRAKRRDQLIAASIFALSVIGLASYYGSAVPQSVMAKAGIYGMPGPLSGIQWWDWLVPFPLGRWPISSEGIQLIPLSLLFLVSLMYGIREWRGRFPEPVTLLPLAGVTILAGYALSGTAYFWWYLTVPLASLSLLAAMGFPLAATARPFRIAALAVVLGVWALAFPFYQGRAGTEYVNNVSASNVLKQLARPDDQVLIEPMGLVGFETRLRVLDEVGLVTPETVRRRQAGAGWYADLVATHRPEWIVVRNATVESPNGYAGVGAPFRNESERNGTFSQYELVWPTSPTPGINLRVLRRLG